MSAGWVVAIVLAIGAVAYFLAAQRARAQRAATDRATEVPHSLPTYHGWLAFIFATVPALVVLLVVGRTAARRPRQRDDRKERACTRSTDPLHPTTGSNLC